MQVTNTKINFGEVTDIHPTEEYATVLLCAYHGRTRYVTRKLYADARGRLYIACGNGFDEVYDDGIGYALKGRHFVKGRITPWCPT